MNFNSPFLLILFGFFAMVFGEKNAPEIKKMPSPKMAVLDLVDLQDNQIKAEPSDWLRKSLATMNAFVVMPKDSMVKKLGEFNVKPEQACNNSQCSFDAGNYLQSDFILYGTYSSLAGIDAVTLKLLYVPKAIIAWTWVGEISTESVEGGMAGIWERRFSGLAKILNTANLVLEKPKEHKTLAVIDLSEQSYLSRVFSERLGTRISGFAKYDIISPSELADLLTAMEINKFSITPSPENMVGLGMKLAVSNLVYSRFYRDGKSFLCRLSIYDIDKRVALLEMPPKPTENFSKLLAYEKDFFIELIKKEQAEKNKTVLVDEKGKSKKPLWISLGLLGVGGGLTAFWVQGLKKDKQSLSDFMDPIGPPGDKND